MATNSRHRNFLRYANSGYLVVYLCVVACPLSFDGFTLAMLYNLWNMATPTPLEGPVTSSLVHDRRGEGVYMTLKLKCFYCDTENFGRAWETLIQDTNCQDSIFSSCFLNQTAPERQTTEVIDLIKSCKQNCACSDSEGWCTTTQCRQELRCCWEKAYCNDE